jgi:hypothetical protein
MSDNLEQRIRERAHRMWLAEGQPEGKAEAHWELARMAIALQDAKPQMQRPVTSDTNEPVDAWMNQGSFPLSPIKASSMLPVKRPDPDR